VGCLRLLFSNLELTQSKGTRVHIYRWLNSDAGRAKASEAQLKSLPEIETDKKWTKKIHPGAWPAQVLQGPRRKSNIAQVSRPSVHILIALALNISTNS
jgi:hypothetical protein